MNKKYETNDMLVSSVIPESAKLRKTHRSPKRGKIRLCQIENDGPALETSRVFGDKFQAGTMTRSLKRTNDRVTY